MAGETESPFLNRYPPIPVALDHAEGCELVDRKGKRFLDFYGGHCVCILGHNPPELKHALIEQMERLTFYSTALDLPERDEAARLLLDFAPQEFTRLFFVNSGAEANDNALKFALAHTRRRVVLAIEGAFHGRTAATDAVTGDARRMPHFPRAPFEVRWVPFDDVERLREVMSTNDVGVLIIEPVQSMAGCRVHSPQMVSAMNELCVRHGTLVISDEIQGGLGRCIDNWSHQSIGLRVDIITTAKGLGAGFPVAALLTRGSLGVPPGSLFGSTFGGGPLACAAVIATMRRLVDTNLRKHVSKVSEMLNGCARIDGITSVQGLGLLRGIRTRMPSAKLREGLLKRGIIVGGSNDPGVTRLMPPLTVSREEVTRLTSALAAVLKENR